MPRTKYLIPERQKQLEEELRERYGGMMNAKQVGIELGYSRYSAYRNWLSDVPYIKISQNKKYRVAEIAKKMYQNETVPETYAM